MQQNEKNENLIVSVKTEQNYTRVVDIWKNWMNIQNLGPGLKQKLSFVISFSYYFDLSIFDEWIIYCSDFRYESNGIFVLGVGFFFLQTNFDFLTSHFDGIFLYHSKGIVVLSLNLKRYFTCDHFS